MGKIRHFDQSDSVNSVCWASYKRTFTEKRLQSIVRAVSKTIEGKDIEHEVYAAELKECVPPLFEIKKQMPALSWVRLLKTIIFHSIAGCKKQGTYVPKHPATPIPELPCTDEGRVVGLLLTKTLHLDIRDVFCQVTKI